MTLFFQLLALFNRGLGMTVLPGIPVDIEPYESGFIVACTDSARVFIWSQSGPITEYPGEFTDPVSVCVWKGEPAVSDRGSHSITAGDSLFFLQGTPEGICQVSWMAGNEPQLAVCFADMGQVVLLSSSGEAEHLADVPLAKSAAAADADGDGDEDLFVSGCTYGVVLLENRDSSPVVHRVGNIGEGVKRISLSDIDGDGLIDVAGIACSDGGAGWWRNPGYLPDEWEYTEIDGMLNGPKDISTRGDSVAAVSLFSPVFADFQTQYDLPKGFTSCSFGKEGVLVLGHRLGFLVVLD